jgi:prophage regulatory protein
MSNQFSQSALLRLPSVQAQTALSKTEIYRRIKAGSFPKPIKLGARAVAWPASSIDAYIKSLIEAS